jgi:type IV secretion system protein VirB2
MNPKTKKWISCAGTLTGLSLVLASPAYAQISQLTSGLDWIKTTLSGVAVVIIIIAIIWTGVKMMFQHAKWSEVAHIFFGGILAGGATAIAGQLFAGGGGGG